MSLKKLKGVRVLLRIDANVTFTRHRVAPEEAFRLDAVLPTLMHLISKGARVIVISHRGRPEGKRDPTLSLRPVARFFEKKLRTRIRLFETIADAKNCNLTNGQCIMLENLRFNKGEATNSKVFAAALASLADIYVNEAFPVCHRNAASVVAITRLLPSYAGISLLKELKMLTRVREKTMTPLVVVLGGVKLETRIPLLHAFAPAAQAVLLGAKMGYAIKLSKSKKYPSLVYPMDCKKRGNEIVDIGPLTIAQYAPYIAAARMIICNGTMEKEEKKEYAKGTQEMARLIAKSKAFSVVGGGETVKIILQQRLQHSISFISTGGGAMLAFLAGQRMPGLDALG